MRRLWVRSDNWDLLFVDDADPFSEFLRRCQRGFLAFYSESKPYLDGDDHQYLVVYRR